MSEFVGENVLQSRTQSHLAFWSAGGCQERLWGTGILLPQDFCGNDNASRYAITEKPIKKIFFFEFSRVSPGDQPLAKEPEDSVRDCLRGGESSRFASLDLYSICFFIPWTVKTSGRLNQDINENCNISDINFWLKIVSLLLIFIVFPHSMPTPCFDEIEVNYSLSYCSQSRYIERI